VERLSGRIGKMGESMKSEPAAASGRLAGLPLFGALDAPSLAALEAELDRLAVPGGATLFREGEGADALYLVLSGCLGVTIRNGDGTRVIARVHAGETIGEMAVLDGSLRSATAIALRDTELLRLGNAEFERLVGEHPRSMLALVSLLARRLRETTHPAGDAAPIRTVALIPTDHAADHRTLVYALADRLARDGRRVARLDGETSELSAERLNAVETASDLVLYCGEVGDTDWTRLCLRQADRVMLVAPANSHFTMPEWLAGQALDWRRPLDLVLLHDGRGDAASVGGGDARRQLPFDLICHVRRGNSGDVGRIVRILTGKSVGLVLSAGGARGFAHLGVVRALREAHVPIDLIGGCSMGAIVGACVACEWDDAEIRDRLRRAFVDSNPVNDYTLPFFALAKGEKVARRLQQHFGSIRIEDLWRPFFCVSANLTVGVLAVHRSGSLTPALRASVAIPGLLPPVMMAGEAHVDGGTMNCLPVDVMKPMCGSVIAVDVASDPVLTPLGESERRPSLWQFLRQRRKIPPIVDLLVRAATIGTEALAKTSRDRADMLFRPPLETVDLLDWRACDRAIEAGYRHAIEQLERSDKSAPAAP
jgi:NTE family protein